MSDRNNNPIVNLLANWLLAGLAIFITAYLLPGVSVSGFVAALVLAVVLGAINAFVKPVLIVLTLPITVLSLGLFVFVINALLVMLAGLIVPGFSVDNFWWALLFALVLSVVNAVFYRMANLK